MIKVIPEHGREIDFSNIHDIIFWAKKWEVSAYQVMEASFHSHTCNVRKIEQYLREKGFAV